MPHYAFNGRPNNGRRKTNERQEISSGFKRRELGLLKKRMPRSRLGTLRVIVN